MGGDFRYSLEKVIKKQTPHSLGAVSGESANNLLKIEEKNG